MSRIFISHSNVDNALALAIGQWLEREGWDDYFLDVDAQRGLAPGERWQAALKAAADRCQVVLFLISPAWLDSRWCLAEFLLAKQLGKSIFGVMVEKVEFERIPREMTAEWQLCDLVSGDERQEFDVAKRPLVAAARVALAEPGLQRLRIGLQRAGLDPTTFPWPPPHDPNRSPYPGLRAHDMDDAAVFFGRDAAIVRGLDMLRGMRERGTERAFVILGASGSGKSAFLRAGLWPRLARDDRHFMPLLVVRPERAGVTGASGLLASLDAAFNARGMARSRAGIRGMLEQPDGLARALTELTAARKVDDDRSPPTVVLAIDQAEELFAGEGQAEGARLLDLLGPLMRPPAGGTAIAGREIPALVVFAIRSDSIELLQTSPQMQDAKLAVFSLPPLAAAEYKAVIESPAARHRASGRKLEIEPALTEALTRDAEGADALPLVAFTLERLYIEHGGSGRLTLQHYQALGGVRGAIEAAVEETFREPGREPAVPPDASAREHVLRQAFVPWLALVDPETGQRKRRIAKWDELPAASHPVLERLVASRLLTRDRRRLEPDEPEAVVLEVAHEALLRQWSTLAAWLDADADALKTLEGLRRAGAEWAKNEARADWLVHTGDRLAAAGQVLARPDFRQSLGDEGQAYFRACLENVRRLDAERKAQLERTAAAQRRTAHAQRIIQWILSVSAMLLLALALWAAEQAREVGRQQSRLLAALAEQANDEGFHDRALRLAVLAARGGWWLPVDEDAPVQLARAAHHSSLEAVMAGHKGYIVAASFSPDGKRVLTASHDNTARLWDVASGRELVLLTGHKAELQSAAFSPDSKRALTASRDGTARVWDASSGLELAVLTGHSEPVRSAVFTADGMRVVTASQDGTARIWDATTGQEMAAMRGHKGTVYSAAVSADGKRVLTASLDTTARIWHAATGRELIVLRGHESDVYEAVFSPDGMRVLTRSADNTARIWDAKSGHQLATLKAKNLVMFAAFNADGTRVLTASGATASVWGAESGRELAVLRGHERGVFSAAFSPDSRHVVTASADMTARFWDASTGREMTVLKGHAERVHGAVFSADGTRLLTTSFDRTARVWSTATGREMLTLEGHAEPVVSAAFSTDRKRVLTTSEDGTARLWDATSGHQMRVLTHPGEGAAVTSAAFSADGTLVVTASTDRTARVWEAASGRELWVLKGHKDSVISAAFSADATRVVTGSEDWSARIWDLKNGREHLTKPHEGWVASAAFGAESMRVVTADGKVARVWDAENGRDLAVLGGRDGRVHFAAPDAYGLRVVAASQDNTARIWDMQSGAELAVVKSPAYVFSAAFSPDGARVVTACADGTARLWDAASGRELAALKVDRQRVNHASFSADGISVVTASEDRTARIWDVSWSVLFNSSRLLTEVCQRKLIGVIALVTAQDVEKVRFLRRREGEDVCAGLR